MFSSLKKKARKRLANLKKNIKDKSQNFKENFEKAKNQPKSKRRSFFLGFTVVLSIFGVTLLTPVLSASAKDMSKKGPKPGSNDVCPNPTGGPPINTLTGNPPMNKPTGAPSEEIIKGVTGAAATVCALAVKSGSFAVGIACGVIVVFGILKAQGK